VGNESPVDKTQVEPVGVVRVWQYSGDHSATGNAITLELRHLVSRWSGVASGDECFPRKAWKPSQCNPLVRIVPLASNSWNTGESHLYKNATHVRSQGEWHVKWWSCGSCE
jgi:hypothetical protein